MFARPGPDTTRSISTRPYSLVNASASACSSALRGAKSTCPPSDARGTSRPSTFGSSAMPSPVPAAISATLPPGSGRPSCSTSISSDVSTGTDHASASRSLSKYARGMAASRRSASRSTIHGTFVKCARAPVIGPATPNPAASMSWGAVEVSRRKCKDTAPRSGKSSVRYDRISMAFGRAPFRANRPRKILVPPTSPASSMAP